MQCTPSVEDCSGIGASYKSAEVGAEGQVSENAHISQQQKLAVDGKQSSVTESG